MGRRFTVEQALRADWQKADKAVKEANVKLKAAQQAVADATTRKNYAQTNVAAAKTARAHIEATLETYLGKQVEQEEVSDDDSAAPATTGADAEVQPDSEATTT